MGEFVLVLALALDGLGTVPTGYALAGVAILLATLHTLLDEPFGADMPFWSYYRVAFGVGPDLPFWAGFLGFAGLWAALSGLAVWGFVYGSPFAVGALAGAMLADALVSHVFLQRAFWPLRNPGLLTAPLYVIFVVALLALKIPMEPLGGAVGAGAFIGFWLLSFTASALKGAVRGL